MALMNFHCAPLTESGVEEIHSLESDLGKVVLALKPGAPIARLSKEQLARLTDLEQRLGVVIVAYEPS